MNRFIAKMQVPAYNKFTQYNYHDVLLSLSNKFFAARHATDYRQR
jgi:hypothetical protein